MRHLRTTAQGGDGDRPDLETNDDQGGCGAQGGRPVSVDRLNLTTYLHADNEADGSFTETFVLRVGGGELNGAPVNIPGLGTAFGMYFVIDAAGVQANGLTTFSSLHVALMVDPGNNDGAASATKDGIGFANGTGGDYALATGSLVSAALSRDLDDTRHADFVETVAPTKAGRTVFGPSLHPGDQLQELLTTPVSALQVIPPQPGVVGHSLVNGGLGTAQLTTSDALRLQTNSLLDHGGCGATGMHW